MISIFVAKSESHVSLRQPQAKKKQQILREKRWWNVICVIKTKTKKNVCTSTSVTTT